MSDDPIEYPQLQYQRSAEIGELYGALAKAQGKIKGAVKDSKNPHFNSRYADLASVVAACRAELSEAGIAVVQVPHNVGKDIGVTTILGHSSGQWLSGTIAVSPVKWDAQGLGSVVTYLRRYSLAAMAGVAPEDDDGEAAVGRPSEARPAAALHTVGATRTYRRAIKNPTSAETEDGKRLEEASRQPVTEDPAATAARHRIRMLIDKFDNHIKTAPSVQALNLCFEDGRDELAEIEAVGDNGKAALQQLRDKFMTRIEQLK